MTNDTIDNISNQLKIRLAQWNAEGALSEHQKIISRFSDLLENDRKSEYQKIFSVQPSLLSNIEFFLQREPPLLEPDIIQLAIIISRIVTLKWLITGRIQKAPIDESTFHFYLSDITPQSEILINTLELCSDFTHQLYGIPYERLKEHQNIFSRTTDELQQTLEKLTADTQKELKAKLQAIEANAMQEREKLAQQIEQEKMAAQDVILKYEVLKESALNTLAESFSRFKTTKRTEKNNWLKSVWLFGIIATVVALTGIFIHPLTNITFNSLNLNTVIASIAPLFEKGLPYIFIFEILIIYFFRISLTNYYAARDELLQIEIREALCLFAPTYTAFAAADDNRLEDFSKHVFSPIASKLNPTPHPLDFLAQVSKAFNRPTGK